MSYYHHLSGVTAMADWLVENGVSPYTGVFRWFSNGERGHLHISDSCEKITRSRSNTVERQLTLPVAQRDYVLCKDCFYRIHYVSPWHDEVFQAADDLHRHLSAARQVGRFALSEGDYPTLTAAARRRILKGFLDAVECLTMPADLHLIQECAIGEITGMLAEYHDDNAKIIDEALHLAASTGARSAVLQDFRRGGFWVTEKLQHTFEIGGYGRENPVEKLLNEWAGRAPIADAASAMKACVAAAAAEASSNLTSSDQLRHVPALPARPGESALDAAKRSFVAYSETVLNELGERLLVKHLELVARRQLVVFALEDRWNEWLTTSVHNAEKLILHEGLLARSKTRCVVALPEALAEWVTSTGLRHHIISGLIAVDELPDTAVAETALALWEPHGVGAYKSFEDALEAAKIL